VKQTLIKTLISVGFTSLAKMSYRHLFARSSFFSPSRNVFSVRHQSQAAALVDVKSNDAGYAVVSMQKAPVNSLSLELIQSISNTLTELEKDKCKGFILTSNLSSTFSAGLDIREMYKPDPDRLKNFWQSLQDLWLKLYGSKMAAIALINGHAPAGGCLLSMCCDYRIMVDGKSKIGLNETRLGIVAPFWFKDTMENCIGTRQTELALQLGTLFSVSEAHKIGLIDEVAPDLPAGIKAAENQLQQFLKIPATARFMSKMVVRGETLKRLEKIRDADVKQFVMFATSPQVQTGLGKYLESLSKKA